MLLEYKNKRKHENVKYYRESSCKKCKHQIYICVKLGGKCSKPGKL